jgi:hypothetical protein
MFRDNSALASRVKVGRISQVQTRQTGYEESSEEELHSRTIFEEG